MRGRVGWEHTRDAGDAATGKKEKEGEQEKQTEREREREREREMNDGAR